MSEVLLIDNGSDYESYFFARADRKFNDAKSAITFLTSIAGPVLITKDNEKLKKLDEITECNDFILSTPLLNRECGSKITRTIANDFRIEDRVYYQRFIPPESTCNSIQQYIIFYCNFYLDRGFRLIEDDKKYQVASERILVDAQNLRTMKNGTQQVIVSLVSGLKSLGYEVDVWARKKAFETHGLQAYANQVWFPRMKYDTVVFVGQPFYLSRLLLTSAIAERSGIIFLDTISQDVRTMYSDNTEIVWSDIYKIFTNMIFISQSAQKQYVSRYLKSSNDIGGVSYLPITDFVKAEPSEISILIETTFTLIVGNDFLHKGIADCLKELPIIAGHKYVVQTKSQSRRNDVISIRPGSITDSQIKWLYLNCISIIYPTYREGFGLPLIQSAVSGKKISVRRLDVFLELTRRFEGLENYIIFCDDFRSYEAEIAKLCPFEYKVTDKTFAKSILENLETTNFYSLPAASILEISKIFLKEIILKIYGKLFSLK